MDTIKIGIIQQSIGTDVESNRQKLAACISNVAARGAQLVVLQELHNSPYFCQVESTENFSYAEPAVNWSLHSIAMNLLLVVFRITISNFLGVFTKR